MKVLPSDTCKRLLRSSLQPLICAQFRSCLSELRIMVFDSLMGAALMSGVLSDEAAGELMGS